MNGIATKENHWECDAAVIWSVLWHGRMADNESVYEYYREQGKPVICIDVGSLIRGTTWKIAVNNINALGYYGHKKNIDSNRPKKLGLELKDHAKKKEAVLLATQHAKSLQVQEIDYLAWIENTIAKIKRFTDRPIVMRPHPRCKIMPSAGSGIIVEQPRHVNGTYDSYDISFEYHATVNYCSTPGIQSAMSGCPTIVDISSLAYPVSIAWQDLEDPIETDRTRWLAEISHTEYTVEEIAQGRWLKRLEDQL